jgi:deoxyribodipyrimidine photo-lyase
MEPDEQGEFVLYWMQINRRFHYNYALEYAIAYANRLGIPLLILETLTCDYPWASDRFHQFLMEGMLENKHFTQKNEINHYIYLEKHHGEILNLVEALGKKAAIIISDEYPVFIMRDRNEYFADKLDVPYITVDSNGIIPLKITDKAPYSAYLFRKIMQKHFLDSYTMPPKENPINDLEVRKPLRLDTQTKGPWPDNNKLLNDINGFINDLPIDHSVTSISIKGTRKAALDRLDSFINNDLKYYGEHRNDPDYDSTSRLSPWLHFGKISEYEIVKAVLNHQPENWDISIITDQNGKREGFFKGHSYIEKFLDELITWREVGFHFAHHTLDYDKFESLPDWALETMAEHKDDPREYIYSQEEFEHSLTHDEIWNAAQRQLVREGYIHNYLRMLWGKKILEWTPNPRKALSYMIQLNNKFAIDGRDPNSYSGIFWILGRFDRPWFERPIFGKIRYMSSESTRKKVKLKKYLEKYGK